jgi:pimeloyl-ACP methyl ester carboxylesterase
MTGEHWKKLGTFQSVLGHQLFVIDASTSSAEPNRKKETMVFLHGYPTSTFDYYKVFSQLSERYRLVMHDHLGFGFSDKPKDIEYSLIDQADRALELWKQLDLKKVTLFAHDYGTSVATEIIARHNAGELDIEIEKLILCNGSIHIELSQLRTIQKLLKHKFWGKYVAMLTNYPIFRKNMRNTFFDKSKVTDDELKEMWKLIELNGGRKIIHKLTQYITERYQYWDRWVGAVKETLIPTKILWAKNDPIAIPEIAELLASEIHNNELIWLENTGHFLMLENPEEWLQHILK